MNAAIAHQPEPTSIVATFLRRAPRLLIGGEWTTPVSSTEISVIDPATEQRIATVADAGVEDVNNAVQAARRAFEAGAWHDMPPARREALLWRLADLIEAHGEELAELESLDNGKTLLMARMVDIPAACSLFRYMAGWATKLEGVTIRTSFPMPPEMKFHTYTQREAVGVVAQIIPWNFPLVVAASKLAPALAAGCTCILKPAEQTPLTALRLGELIIAAGFPPGVVNIITGRGESAGAALVAHPGVDKVSFTGSTPVGKAINRSATETMKRVTLELGGKSPVIALADAHVPSVIGGAAQAIFFNAGQVCTAGSRLYVHRRIFDHVAEGVCAAARSIRLGPGLDAGTQMGPLVSREQQQRVLGLLESGRRQGAEVLAGGQAPDHAGYYIQPTVLTKTTQDMQVVREEIFGPVLVVQPFDDIEQVAALANDTSYGLGASIWSNDMSAVHRLIPALRVGTVWVNCHGLADANLPYGGVKLSGFGRENGRAVVEAHTELKSVCIAV